MMWIATTLAIAVTAVEVARPRSRPRRRPEVIAHRGASADAPENTLAAFRLGYAQGADACELDLHLGADGRLIVIHDATTDRTAGVHRVVARSTLDALRRLDVAHFGPWASRGDVAPEPPPTLEEVLALVPPGRRLFVEAKAGPEVVPPLAAALARGPLEPSRVAIISFVEATCRAAKRRLPGHEVHLLCDAAPADAAGAGGCSLDDLVRRAGDAGLDGVDLAHAFPLDAAAVARAHAAGLKVYVWTVDDPSAAAALAAAGVDGITTNVPAAVRRAVPADD